MRIVFTLIVLVLITSPCLGRRKKLKLLQKQVDGIEGTVDEIAEAGGVMDGKIGDISGNMGNLELKVIDLEQRIKGNYFECHHYTKMETETYPDEKSRCERQGTGRIFTGGDNANYPGCGTCWCCQPVATSGGSGGATYVRWGRMDCPATAELVYSGYAGGSLWRQTGGAANYLCLTKEPVFEYVEPALQNSGGLVYGAEYEPYRKNPEGFVGKDLDDQDVPCAVCRTKRSSVLMIPGRNACSSDDWTLEYKGYLSSGSSGQPSATEFVCLDGKPEALPGVHANVDGKLFYFVEGRCGSLKCPPYKDGHELTCAVCSK